VIPAGSAEDDEKQIIPDLYAATSADIFQLMQPESDNALRQNLFMRWAEKLALPLAQQPNALIISRLEKQSETLMLLLESPEPLRFSTELSLEIKKEITLPDQSLHPANIRDLESVIPPDLVNLEERLPEMIHGVRGMDIKTDRITIIVSNRLIQSLSQAPRFALIALASQGQLKYFCLN
jgi:hypothetical protein